jgi:TonB family protein
MNFVHGRDIARSLSLVLALFVSVNSAIAQTTPDVDDVEAQAHLLKHIDPIYPPIAKAARINGEVVLQIEIDRSGQVTKVKPISGPAMLLGAATEAAKQWQYKPFEKNGVPLSVTAKVRMPFTLDPPADPNDEEIAKIYFPLSMKCNQLVNQRATPEEQASACQKAADQADRFSKTSRFIERRSAYVYLTTALIRNKRPKEAVAVGEKAIAVVLQGHDDGSGSSAAYSVTGQAKAWSGDLAGSDKDIEIAENYERKAIDTPAGHELNKEYSQTLKSLLTFHAQVLTALGEQAQAQAKLDEAGKL